MPWKECHVVDERLRFVARLLDGEQMAGTWKIIVRNSERMVDLTTLRKLTSVESRAVAETAARYGRFLGMPVSITDKSAVKSTKVSRR